MVSRWWLLFRSLAVLTILVLTPLMALQELLPWSYFLSTMGAVAELALEISIFLLLEAVGAAVLAAILTAGRVFRLWAAGAEANCAGVLGLLIAAVCLLVFLSPLDTIAGPVASAAVQAALLLALIVVFTLVGWRRVGGFFNRLNQSAQIVLAICPLLLVAVIAGGFGWRSFNAIAPVSPDPNLSTAPNVVLISFDALTAQDMSLYGYGLPTTPQFQRLARRSYNFVNFFSTSDFTTPAAASLLTGQYPLEHRVFQLYGHIPRGARTHNIAWILRHHGYTTAAIVTNPGAHPMTLRIGDSFSALPWPPISPWFFPGTLLLQLSNGIAFNTANGLALYALKDFGCLFDRFNRMRWVRPEAVFSAARDFMRAARRPYFLWIHLYPPHAPYVTDARFRGRFLAGSEFSSQAYYLWRMPAPSYPAAAQREINCLRLRYDESIAECDRALGDFLDWMGANGQSAHTLLIITSDHGENFSAGWFGHASPDLHYSETHIPLLISLPGQDRAYTIGDAEDLTDVAPTILAVLGIQKPSWMEGHSLIGPIRPAPQPAFSMYLARSSPFGRLDSGAIAADAGSYHVVWYFPSGFVALFDVAQDPEALHNAVALHPEAATALVADIEKRFGNALQGNAAGVYRR